MNNSANLLSSC